MAFVHGQSCECAKAELDLFLVPPTQTSIEQGNWIEYHPITVVAGDSPVEFDINGSGEDYLDFANTMLYVKAKLTRAVWWRPGGRCRCRSCKSVSVQSLFPSGHFAEWYSDNAIDQVLSLSCHVGNTAELRRSHQEISANVCAILQRSSRYNGVYSRWG